MAMPPLLSCYNTIVLEVRSPARGYFTCTHIPASAVRSELFGKFTIKKENATQMCTMRRTISGDGVRFALANFDTKYSVNKNYFSAPLNTIKYKNNKFFAIYLVK